MSNKSPQVINKEFHPQAKEHAQKLIANFATSLISQAKLLAFRREAEVVLSRDVDDALSAITLGRTQSLRKQLVIAFGGAMFGAFLEGFIGALSPVNVIQIVLYVIMGFIGMFLVFWGLRG